MRGQPRVPADEVGIIHAGGELPSLEYPRANAEGDELAITVRGGIIVDVMDPSSCLAQNTRDSTSLRGTAATGAGNRTMFMRVRRAIWDGWLPADLRFEARPRERAVPSRKTGASFAPVDISSRLNIALGDIHQQQYLKPRPAGYSLMCNLNGRFAWDWNQKGFGVVEVDDRALRSCCGLFRSPSGIGFATPASGNNAACVSVWENFPDELVFPLEGTAHELAVLVVGVTNPMQSRVENARLSACYADGDPETVSLVNPVNFDDWLVAAVQQENETVYFSDCNHAMVVRIPLDPSRTLRSLKAKAIANEVVLGLLGVSLAR